MRQQTAVLDFQTAGRDLLEITGEVRRWVQVSGIRTGLLTLLCQHTSASLLINENAAPAVRRDLLRWLDRIAPESTAYEHDDEGPDDMPAHIKALLTGNSLTIPVDGGRPMLGTWQGIYLAEHRARPHRRTVAVHLLGA
ncbi:secondary thiamine-phosphate synthase enzyme YjbQ [Caenibius sp. WL]|uniref:secondary thiamine-phosphate synthase enzyme YjbQ n=1 Tax=Caenibius sp. WL TaxID=2872646 RepID=UPI001C9A1017|nr:secondary thiamine-phosphate synthase enzyme YjbQ [Caenibius sp. WL]QZP08069.1 secondary thiamine-phosphate synthase enzyme YjbQ [Caenibius sp. WL]